MPPLHSVCPAAVYTHLLQIHGDLKPANVMLKAARNDRRGFICKVRLFDAPLLSLLSAAFMCQGAPLLSFHALQCVACLFRHGLLPAPVCASPRSHALLLIAPPSPSLLFPLQLGDFGLSRMLGAEESHVDTQVSSPCVLDQPAGFCRS